MAKKIVLISILVLQSFVVAPLTYGAEGEGADLEKESSGSFYQYSVHPKDKSSAIKEIDVTASQIENPNGVEQSMNAVLEGKKIDEITVLSPDDPNTLPLNFKATVAEATKNISAPQQEITVQTRYFADWFNKSKFRLSIIAFEVTTITGLKYTELVLSPQPVQHSVAFTCGILMGSMMGIIEWNSPSLMKFLKNTSTPVREFINRITLRAKEGANGPVATTLWQFFKNSSINLGVFSVFKLILYGTTMPAHSMAATGLNAIHALSPHDLGNSALLAIEATAVSFPTTKVILAYMARATAQAQGDTQKLLRVKDMVTLMVSSALTARALLFSSMMIAVTFDWPQLKYAAIGGLGAMVAGSTLKLFSNAKRDRQEAKCNISLSGIEPSLKN